MKLEFYSFFLLSKLLPADLAAAGGHLSDEPPNQAARLDFRLCTEAENDAITAVGAAVVIAAVVVDIAKAGAVARRPEPPGVRGTRGVVLNATCIIRKQSRINNTGVLLICAESDFSEGRNPDSIIFCERTRSAVVVVSLLNFFDCRLYIRRERRQDCTTQPATHCRRRPTSRSGV